MKNGQKFDVMIEDWGSEGIIIWADEGLSDFIADIPGVQSVDDHKSLYFVELDHRYDWEFMKKDIEQRILAKIKSNQNGETGEK
jgi:hypothetical protein